MNVRKAYHKIFNDKIRYCTVLYLIKMNSQKLVFFIWPDERRLWATAGDRAPLGIGYLSSYCKELLGVKTKIFYLNHDSEEFLNDSIVK